MLGHVIVGHEENEGKIFKYSCTYISAVSCVVFLSWGTRIICQGFFWKFSQKKLLTIVKMTQLKPFFHFLSFCGWISLNNDEVSFLLESGNVWMFVCCKKSCHHHPPPPKKSQQKRMLQPWMSLFSIWSCISISINYLASKCKACPFLSNIIFNILPFYIIFLRIQIVLTIHFLHICKYSCTDWEPYASFRGL